MAAARRADLQQQPTYPAPFDPITAYGTPRQNPWPAIVIGSVDKSDNQVLDPSTPSALKRSVE